MILSDSILLSFKDPLYLSTVGIIDSIFLLFLAIGESMNDSFQIFYSRHYRNASRCRGIFLHSIPLFCGVGLIFALFCSLIPFSNVFFYGGHFETLASVVPYLSTLIILSFISLSLNSLLMGWGYTKFLGCVSFISVLANFVLGYILLYVYELGINPCAIIIITSTLAELLAIIFMSIKIICVYNKKHNGNFNYRHQSLIFGTIVYASIYPCLSDIGFHLGSLALYTYCLCYFLDTETALFTLFMSYWGILQVPCQGFSETSINYFSKIYSNKLLNLYDSIKNRVLSLSILTSGLFCLIIILADILLYGLDIRRLSLFALIMGIVWLNTFGKITETSLLVRLKNNSFIVSKILYASMLILGIFLLTIMNRIGITSIFTCFLIAQLFNCVYLKITDYRIWHEK